MVDLAQERCVACRPDSPRVTDAEMVELLPQIPLWEVKEEDGVRKLQRAYAFRNFAEALEFTNMVGAMAEEEDHHPTIVTEWGKVTLIWWTHTIRGLHRNDFLMAAKSDVAYERLQDQSGR